MSDMELEEYIKKIEPNFDSHIEKGTIEMSNEYYNLLEEKMSRLINENQQLKEQLEKNKLNHKQLKDLEKTQLLNSYQIEKLNKKQEQLDLYKSVIDEVNEFLKGFHNYENRFKWCEQDYIDTIYEIEKILDKANIKEDSDNE